ncbi:MAG TPA: glycosyltransferase family 2 protein [Solirubrobacterales bacterium]|nr:glycosyltransferase family 2 protein [Solirubrobacterales bacterium]
MPASPRISVLLPLQDEREAGLECVRAWTEQRADPKSFEILALAPGEDDELERAVQPMLRAHDRWIVAPGKGEYELFNLGAEEAAGEFVFVTEAHCVPEPDCLPEMLAELERSGAPGVRGNSVPEAVGPLGALERDAFEEALRVEEDPEHWRKILIHSLALRRDLYLAAGGLPSSYGDFAPWPLAIALHSGGKRLVFSPRPRVRHVYDGDLGHLGSHVRSFGRGEMRYRAERGRLAGRYLGPALEWEQQLAHTRRGAWHAVRAGIALRHRGTLREVLRHASVAVLGPRLSIARARLAAAVAGRRARRSADAGRARPSADADGARREFAEFWRLTSRRGRLEGLAAAGVGEAEALPAATSVDLGESLAGRSIGVFHQEIGPDGGPVRWTSALAAIKLDVPGAGIARARVELMPFARPPDSPEPEPRVAVDDRVVPVAITDGEMSFDLPAGVHWIWFACTPFHPRRSGKDDPRPLGLPVRALRFEPG